MHFYVVLLHLLRLDFTSESRQACNISSPQTFLALRADIAVGVIHVAFDRGGIVREHRKHLHLVNIAKLYISCVRDLETYERITVKQTICC